jgi:hypothetical protein
MAATVQFQVQHNAGHFSNVQLMGSNHKSCCFCDAWCIQWHSQPQLSMWLALLQAALEAQVEACIAAALRFR